MTRLRSIELASRSDLFPVHLIFHFVPNEQAWDIKHIEVFADPEHQKLLADDVQIDELPHSTQALLLAALDEHVAAKAQRQRGMERLLADLKAEPTT
jgi:hypothetical protein